ncbi:MAG: 2-phosphosulfolactate phosphatase [Gracilibacter sp. BRH_c7a]|nr:MAG: 2-phosphosulfolactate phosphatase [Gracilibacter sp. BRH_c7a]
MLIDVLPSAGSPWMPALKNKVAVVIDVFRATSTMVTAFSNGCRAIIPVLTTEEALERRTNEPGYLLGGERRALPIEGFDVGNSPYDYVTEKVGGKTIIMTTTNGTRAIHAVAEARQVWIASFLNAGSVVDAINQYIRKNSEIDGIVIICAGSEDRFDIPDTLCAGMLVDMLGKDMESNDLGRAAQMLYNISKDRLHETLSMSEHGRLLQSIGYEKDVSYCAQPNILSITPVLEDGVVIARTEII